MALRWHNLLSPFVENSLLVKITFKDIVARYNDNGRYYHNLHHIQAVLDHIHPFLAQAQHPVALQLAAWLHDVVYDAHRDDNERQSALFARESLTKLGLPASEIHETERLIMLTATHKTAVSDKDGHILLDADLAILAADPVHYDAYAQAIRQEYAHVPDADYSVGRMQVLTRLRERPFLYHLSTHQNWEAAARANLQRELAVLIA